VHLPKVERHLKKDVEIFRIKLNFQAFVQIFYHANGKSSLDFRISMQPIYECTFRSIIVTRKTHFCLKPCRWYKAFGFCLWVC